MKKKKETDFAYVCFILNRIKQVRLLPPDEKDALTAAVRFIEDKIGIPLEEA